MCEILRLFTHNLRNSWKLSAAYRTAAVLLAGAGCAFGQVTLSLASASAIAGSPVTLNLSMTTTGQPAGLQWTFSYPATDFSSVSVIAGPAAVAAGKSVSCNGSAGSYTCLLVGLNSATIANGVVATATFAVSPATTSTSSAIQVTNDVAVSLSDSALSVTATGGQVTISPAYTLTALTCTPATVTTPGSAACTATVSPAAPAGGLSVTTGVGGGTAGITIPPSATVAAGSTSAGFTVSSAAVSASTTAIIVASLNGTSRNFTWTLTPSAASPPPPPPAPPAPASITCDATTLAPNTSDTCTITLTSSAPTGGVTVTLTLNGSGLTAPASVTVPAGSASAQFNVQAGTIAPASDTLTASVQGIATTASLSLLVSPTTTSGTGGSGTGGFLSDAGSGSTAAVNLTTEGATDWVHWGEPNLNRKAGVTAQLSTYTVVGTGSASRYNNDPRPMGWTDGAPKPKTTGNTDGIYIVGVGNGYSFTAPADTTMRTLTVHVGGWASSATLTAHLSDGSSPDFIDTTPVASGQYDRNYTLVYRAAKAGQTLKITWKMTAGGGNVTLNAAALTASGSLKVAPTGMNLIENGNSLATAVNLTTEGGADWVHWGDAALDRKAGVTAQVSSYTEVGTGLASHYGNDPRPVSWTNGAPSASSTNDTNGVYIAGVGNGFSITVPADTSTRTLIVHVGGWNSSGTLTAHLSDGSSPDAVDTTIPLPGQYDRNYTLTYRAATAGQTLHVTWKMASGGGNVTLNAAALE